jgi:hypothetical protein
MISGVDVQAIQIALGLPEPLQGENLTAGNVCEFGSGGKMYVLDERFADAIPVLERGFGIAVEEVEGAEKFYAVGVRRVERQGAVKKVFGGSVAVLAVEDSGEFDGKSLVVRILGFGAAK